MKIKVVPIHSLLRLDIVLSSIKFHSVLFHFHLVTSPVLLGEEAQVVGNDEGDHSTNDQH